MRIDTNKIPFEGLTLAEEFNPREEDLETDIIKFPKPLQVRADVTRITNAVTVNLSVAGRMHANCSRCLEEFDTEFKKDFALNFQANKLEPVIDLSPQIREEIILDFPIKPLCKADCKGLCPKCGKNLNQGGCSCGST